MLKVCRKRSESTGLHSTESYRQDGQTFTIGEADVISKELNLNRNEVNSIFFESIRRMKCENEMLKTESRSNEQFNSIRTERSATHRQ